MLYINFPGTSNCENISVFDPVPEMGFVFGHSVSHHPLLQYEMAALGAAAVTFTQLIWHTAQMGNCKSSQAGEDPKNQNPISLEGDASREESHFA